MAVYKSVWSSVYSGLRKTGRRLLAGAAIAAIIGGGGAAASAGPYLGPVSTAARAPSNQAQAASTTSQQYMAATSRHYIRGATPAQIVLVIPGFVGGTAQALPADVTWSVTVTDAAGVDRVVTFGGQTAGVCVAGTCLYADPLTGTWTKDGEVRCKWSASTGSGGAFPSNVLIKDGTRGETWTVSNSPISGYPDDGGNVSFYPIAILGMTTSPSGLGIGTSRTESYFDTQDGSTAMGSMERWITPNYGMINLGIGGSVASMFTNTSDPRRQLAKYCSMGIIETGINDFIGGLSDADLRTANIATRDNFADCPNWILQTITPVTDSASGYNTAGDQTAGNSADRTANFSIAGSDRRKTYNTWCRSVPAGFVGCVDTSAASEDPNYPGQWLTPGYTGDGVHETAKANQNAANVVLPHATLLFTGNLVAPNSLSITGASSTVGGQTTGGTGTGTTQAATSTTLAASKNPATVGDTVTLTATVSPAGATGSVAFTEGGVTLGSATLSNGVATLAVSGEAAGSHSIVASYTGSTGYAASASAALALVVNAASGSATPFWRTSLGSDLLAEFDMTDPSTLIGTQANVTGANDVTGNGHVLHITTTGAKVTWSATGSPNGKPALAIPSGAVLMTGASVNDFDFAGEGPTNAAIGMVASKAANSQYARMIDYVSVQQNDFSDPRNAIFLYDNGDGTVGMACGGLGSATAAFANNVQNVVLSQFTGSQHEIWVNEEAVCVNKSTANLGSPANIAFMSSPGGGGPTGTFSGAILSRRDMTAAERTSYQADMRSKWGNP